MNQIHRIDNDITSRNQRSMSKVNLRWSMRSTFVGIIVVHYINIDQNGKVIKSIHQSIDTLSIDSRQSTESTESNRGAVESSSSLWARTSVQCIINIRYAQIRFASASYVAGYTQQHLYVMPLCLDNTDLSGYKLLRAASLLSYGPGSLWSNVRLCR